MFFFFSSRRRHTRWTGDWSSDVCSSDLRQPGSGGTRAPSLGRELRVRPAGHPRRAGGGGPSRGPPDSGQVDAARAGAPHYLATRRSGSLRSLSVGPRLFLQGTDKDKLDESEGIL